MPPASSGIAGSSASTSFAPAVLVYEKRRRWGALLKQRLTPHRIFVRTHTSAVELPPSAARFPMSLIVLDLTTDPAGCLAVLSHLHRASLVANAIAIAPPELSGLEWPLREAGVLSFLDSAVSAETLTRHCLQKLGRTPDPPQCGSPAKSHHDTPAVAAHPRFPDAG